jgi:hypothetical protein
LGGIWVAADRGLQLVPFHLLRPLSVRLVLLEILPSLNPFAQKNADLPIYWSRHSRAMACEASMAMRSTGSTFPKLG